jgi:hypothetical protein
MWGLNVLRKKTQGYICDTTAYTYTEFYGQRPREVNLRVRFHGRNVRLFGLTCESALELPVSRGLTRTGTSTKNLKWNLIIFT